MGFFDALSSNQNTEPPIWIPSTIDAAAEDAIRKGQLPSIQTSGIYLQKGEVCHYEDNARLMNEKVVKEYATRHIGAGMPILGIAFGAVESYREQVGSHTEREFYDGMLYVTNKRTIFANKEAGFDQRHTSITRIEAYENAIEIQYRSKTLCIFVPDGFLLNDLYEMLH